MTDREAPEQNSSNLPPSSEPASSGGPVPIDQIVPSVRIGMLLANRWEVTGILGQGGTAVVFRARDRQEGKTVAVKVLHREFGRDRVMRERFLREAYVANVIQHPAVVQVLGDGFAEDGAPYIVMEMLDGETLDARLERKGGRLPASEVLWAMDRVLDALVAAHAKGIVHRDLKPDNIFLTSDRRIKVLDFGLARLREAAGVQTKLTQIGYVMGTPAFMPPEQARGQWDQVDVQTDLWAVGATMFYLLSGRLVHDGSKVHEVVEAATKNAAPSLRVVAPHLPDAVVDLVDYALVFEMKKRWRSARLMQHALRQAHHALMHGDRRSENGDDEPPSVPDFDAGDEMQPPPMSMRGGAMGPHASTDTNATPPLIVDKLHPESLRTLPSRSADELMAASLQPDESPSRQAPTEKSIALHPPASSGPAPTPTPTPAPKTPSVLWFVLGITLILALGLLLASRH